MSFCPVMPVQETRYDGIFDFAKKQKVQKSKDSLLKCEKIR